MNVLLKPELEKFVVDKVNEALAVLKEQEEFTPDYEAYLRREVGRGLDQLKTGQYSEFDAEMIIADERRRLAGERGPC